MLVYSIPSLVWTMLCYFIISRYYQDAKLCISCFSGALFCKYKWSELSTLLSLFMRLLWLKEIKVLLQALDVT